MSAATNNTPATKADIEALSAQMAELSEMMRRILHVQRAQAAFAEIDRINAQHPTSYTPDDVERLVHEVRAEMQAEKGADHNK